MFELLVKYKVNYVDDGFEIIQPIIKDNQDICDSTTHDFYYLKDKNACFLANYKSVNEKIMNGLVNNKKVFVSKDLNYHYIDEKDIQILENSNKKEIEFGYYIYITKNLNNKYYIFYISDKKVKNWNNDNNIIMPVTKEIYDILLQLYNKYPYCYFSIKDIKENIELSDICIKHFYLTQDNLDEKIDMINMDIDLNLSYTYLSEPTYHVVQYFINKNLLSVKNINRCKYIDLLTFIKNNFYQIFTLEDPFNDSMQFKTITEIESLSGNEKNTILGVFKQDSAVLKIQLYTYIKNNKKSVYKLYVSNIHKTQFLSFQYLNCCSLYNLKYIDDCIISNMVLLDSSLNISTENITIDNIDDAFLFSTIEDILLYYNIDRTFLDIQIQDKFISVDIKTNYDEKFYFTLLPYRSEKNLAILKQVDKKDLTTDDYIYIEDKAIIEYIKHIESKNLIPLISMDSSIIRNININSIMVITPEMKTLDEKKYLLLEKVKQKLYNKYANVNLFEFTYFIKMIEELSLYGVFINIPDDNDFDKIQKEIQELNIADFKKNKLLEYIKIIKNEYTKYDSMQQEFMDFYFNTYMTLEQINDETELNEFTDNTIKKYFG